MSKTVNNQRVLGQGIRELRISAFRQSAKKVQTTHITPGAAVARRPPQCGPRQGPDGPTGRWPRRQHPRLDLELGRVDRHRPPLEPLGQRVRRRKDPPRQRDGQGRLPHLRAAGNQQVTPGLHS